MNMETQAGFWLWFIYLWQSLYISNQTNVMQSILKLCTVRCWCILFSILHIIRLSGFYIHCSVSHTMVVAGGFFELQLAAIQACDLHCGREGEVDDCSSNWKLNAHSLSCRDRHIDLLWFGYGLFFGHWGGLLHSQGHAKPTRRLKHVRDPCCNRQAEGGLNLSGGAPGGRLGQRSAVRTFLLLIRSRSVVIKMWFDIFFVYLH